MAAKDQDNTGPDRVAMPSVKADGTPDQTKDFEVIGGDGSETDGDSAAKAGTKKATAKKDS